MATVLHARVHRARLRQLEDVRPAVIRCPRCGDSWFTDLAAAPLPLIWQDALIAAMARLHSECPDHPHSFEVTS